MFDILILNGTVIDGTGEKRKTIDIGIKGGSISDMGILSHTEALKVIDAKDLFVTPGFIDLHTHSDFTLLLDGRAESFVRQGVTTEVIGNCGLSCAPLGDPDDLKRNVFCFIAPYEADWSSMDQYMGKLEKRELGINVAPLVGHASIRSFVMGYDRRNATEDEMAEIRLLLRESLEAGAWGFSTGLEYFPGIAANREEINTLCDIVKRYDGLYTTHVKNRDEHYKSGFGEAFDTAKQTGVRLQISHAVPKYGAPTEAKDWFLERLNTYRETLDIACDVIPYEWGPTSMTAILPPDVLQNSVDKIIGLLNKSDSRTAIKNQKQPFWLLLRDRCWDKIVLYHSVKFRGLIGKSALQIAEVLQTSPFDALLDILAEEGEDMFSVLMMGKFKRSADLIDIMTHPYCGVISDGLSLSNSGPLKELVWSPGCYGWVSRFLEKFTGENALISLEEGIAKITGLAAQRLGLKNRGLIKKGYRADIVVYNQETFKERGSLFDPAVYPEGIEHVLINGEFAIENGIYSGIGNGELLRK
jgi:N-acyl-D-aspartate/D-glutamate deacylase